MEKVNIRKYIKQMKAIQTIVYEYFENETNEEKDFLNLKDIIINSKIQQNQHKFKSFLYLLSNISNSHHRGLYFFEKIENILRNFKDDISKFYSNSEIFNIFESNKRILLFFLEEKIITMDECIARKIMCDKYISRNYPEYFWPEIQQFKDKKWFINRCIAINQSNFIEEMSKLEGDFLQKRKIGESTNIICEMIRNDSVEEFITYITANKLSVNSVITKLSIYETNLFLLKNQEFSFIEYAAFFGSIQIFRYLLFNKVELPSSLWLYAIHGKNSEIIHILEDNNVDLPKNKNGKNQSKFKYILIESIKCHHNDIAKYFQDKEEENLIDILSTNGIKYHNFAFIQNNLIKKSLFYYFCKYDYK